MDNKNISIELFRISKDSKNLDMIFSCPETHYFTSLEIEVRYLENGKFQSQKYDLSPALFGYMFDSDSDSESDENEIQRRFIVQLPLSKIGISVPAIYIGTFRAQSDIYDDITDTAVCSDVNYAYKCMLDELFMKEGKCEDVISDEVLRKYLLLYGHLAALAVEDFETAQAYFKLIGNCFHKCSPPGRGAGSCCSNTCQENFQPRIPCGIPEPRLPYPCNCPR